jgi:hypothetical protein
VVNSKRIPEKSTWWDKHHSFVTRKSIRAIIYEKLATRVQVDVNDIVVPLYFVEIIVFLQTLVNSERIR